jgi:hypothetical protein
MKSFWRRIVPKRNVRQRIIPRFLIVAGLGLACTFAYSEQAGKLAGYRERVRFESATVADASVEIAMDGAPAARHLRVVRYPGQEIAGVSVSDASGQSVRCNVVPGDGSVEFRLEGPNTPDKFVVHYMVRSSERVRRVPLMTIDVPPGPGEPVAKIEVVLPDGTTAVGTTFPLMTWKDPTHGVATLTTVPSLVLIDWKPVSDVTFADRWLTTESISSVAMFGMILIGSIVWYSRSR